MRYVAHLIVMACFAFPGCQDDWQDQMAHPVSTSHIAVTRTASELPYLLECAYLQDRTERRTCSDRKLLEVLMSNFRVPANDYELDGSLIISFTVRENGSIQDPEIFRCENPIIEQEVLRVLKLLPPFLPAKQDGQAISFQFRFPLHIKWD